MTRVRTNCRYDIGILWVKWPEWEWEFQGRFYMTAQVLWVDLVYWRKVADGYCFFFHFVIVLFGRMVGPFPIVFDILWTLKSCFPFIFKNHVELQVMFSIFSASCWSSSHVIFCHFLIRPSSAWGVMVILHRSSKQYVWWDQKWHFCGRSHCSPQSLKSLRLNQLSHFPHWPATEITGLKPRLQSQTSNHRSLRSQEVLVTPSSLRDQAKPLIFFHSPFIHFALLTQ